MIEMQELIPKSFRDFKEGSIVKGRILEVRPREVLVDIGYKSEGIISLSEFDDPEDVQVGDEVIRLVAVLQVENLGAGPHPITALYTPDRGGASRYLASPESSPAAVTEVPR